MPRLYNGSRETYPRGAVWIDRRSPYGNPFIIGRDGTREEVIARFVCEVLPGLDLEPLRGKDLICHCEPLPCHGRPIMTKLYASP